MTRSLFRHGSVVAAASLAVVLAGCSTTGDTGTGAAAEASATPVAMGALNDTCPMSGRPVDPDAPTVSYAGQTVGFCCGGCVGMWGKMATADKDAFLAKFQR
ncbi:MAG: hypothetical protein ACYS0G_07350 [Planctomycetota bacterium]|jgi:hypothetical protein